MITDSIYFCKMSVVDEFVPFHGFERYALSKSGTIKDLVKGRIMSQYTAVNSTSGYKSVMVSLYNDDGKWTTCIVARLLAKAFIPNPENKPQVDHIDRNSTNNDLSNLRWVTSQEQNLNRNHPIGASGHKHIYKNRNGYRVYVPRLKINKTFKTLDEALAAKAILMSEEEEVSASAPQT